MQATKRTGTAWADGTRKDLMAMNEARRVLVPANRGWTQQRRIWVWWQQGTGARRTGVCVSMSTPVHFTSVFDLLWFTHLSRHTSLFLCVPTGRYYRGISANTATGATRTQKSLTTSSDRRLRLLHGQSHDWQEQQVGPEQHHLRHLGQNL